MNDFPDTIKTAGGLLRPMAEHDLETVENQLSDPDIARWMAAIRHPFDRQDAEDILILSKDPAHRIRTLEKDGVMIGCLCLAPDVWFWLDRDARGQGVMFHAMRDAIAEHFARPAPPLTATSRDDNQPSQALLSQLGFSRIPVLRRMFFHADGGSQPCHDYVMTQEQWLQLYPPLLRHGALTFRPAAQRDASKLIFALPSAGADDTGIWPVPDRLNEFIETHRCRTPGHGLFVAEDENRRIIGMVLLDGSAAPNCAQYLSPEDAARHAKTVETLCITSAGDPA